MSTNEELDAEIEKASVRLVKACRMVLSDPTASAHEKAETAEAIEVLHRGGVIS